MSPLQPKPSSMSLLSNSKQKAEVATDKDKVLGHQSAPSCFNY